ncbi:MAG: hypothetical protein PHU44_10845 [Syntrophales bacterium]|nr:hypothetical protein [Syntrophales bacterium]MDD5642399.1 hypothetical protein [Syntrophales bacterium]
MKFVPNIRRVLFLNALSLGLILAIFLALFYPAWEAGHLGGGQRQTVVENTGEYTVSPDCHQARKTADKFQTLMPLAVLGLVLLTSIGLMIFQFTEIPRYVELTAAGVKWGRWRQPEVFIPYAEIIEVYERPAGRLTSGAICLRTIDKPRLGYRLAFNAYPQAGEIYRELQLRVAKEQYGTIPI